MTDCDFLAESYEVDSWGDPKHYILDDNEAEYTEEPEDSDGSEGLSEDDVLQARDLLTDKLRQRITLLAKERMKKKSKARDLVAQSRDLLDECEQLKRRERKLEKRIQRLELVLDSDSDVEPIERPHRDLEEQEPPSPANERTSEGSAAQDDEEDEEEEEEECSSSVTTTGVSVSVALASPQVVVRSTNPAKRDIEHFVKLYRETHRGVHAERCHLQVTPYETEMVNQLFCALSGAASIAEEDATRTANALDRKGYRVQAFEVVHPFLLTQSSSALHWASRQLWSRGGFQAAIDCQNLAKLTKNSRVTQVYLAITEHLNLIDEVAYLNYNKLCEAESRGRPVTEENWTDLRCIFRFAHDLAYRQNNNTMNEVRARGRELNRLNYWSATQGFISSIATLMFMAFSSDQQRNRGNLWRRAADSGDPFGAFLLRQFAPQPRPTAHASFSMSITGEALLDVTDVSKLTDCAGRGSVAACAKLDQYLDQLERKQLEDLVRQNPAAIPLLAHKLAETKRLTDVRQGISLMREIMSRCRPEHREDGYLLAQLLEQFARTESAADNERSLALKESVFRYIEVRQLGLEQAKHNLEQLVKDKPLADKLYVTIPNRVLTGATA